MANVNIDAATCVGCGLCEQACPEVFKVQEDGIAHILTQSCNAHDLKEVAGQCPVEAIKVG